MKTALWFQLHSDRGIVRVNVQEVVGKGKAARTLPGTDVDVPFAEFSRDEQTVLLDAFDIVARAVDADRADITDPDSPADAAS